MTRNVSEDSATVEVTACAAPCAGLNDHLLKSVPPSVAQVGSSDGSTSASILNSSILLWDFPGWRFSKITPTCSGER